MGTTESDPNSLAQRWRSKIGIGFFTCLGLSVAAFLVQVWIYDTSMEDWTDFERCQGIRRELLAPLEFSIVTKRRWSDLVPAGRQLYKVCYSDVRATPVQLGCDLRLTHLGETKTPAEVLVLGPPNASRRQLELGVRRLGLDGDDMKRIAEAGSEREPIFISALEQSQYRQCQTRPLYGAPISPEFEFAGVLLTWAWIWGFYACGRFMVGE